jgi:hypothetical protein
MKNDLIDLFRIGGDCTAEWVVYKGRPPGKTPITLLRENSKGHTSGAAQGTCVLWGDLIVDMILTKRFRE